jgi:hypothetical protein
MDGKNVKYSSSEIIRVNRALHVNTTVDCAYRVYLKFTCSSSLLIDIAWTLSERSIVWIAQYIKYSVVSELSLWRKLHNEELNDLYSFPNIVRVVKSRRMRWAWHVARMGEGRGMHRVLVGKPEGRRPLGRPRQRGEDNIKRDLEDVGGGCGDWMERAEERDRWRALVSNVL